VVADLIDAAALVDRIAPEHLEIATGRSRGLAEARAPCRRHFPRPLHARGNGRLHRRAQPCAATARTARFSSGLSVLDFLKRSTLLYCTPYAIAKLGPDVIALAEAEGLDAHARSIAARLNARTGR